MAAATYSNPVGTFKYIVGEISRRFLKVSPISAGTGLPSSMYMVPPWCNTKLKSWLPPKVWFQGVQSTNTSGSSAIAGMDWLICWTFAQIIFCVLITPLGNLVEPLVKRNLTIVSGPVACMAWLTRSLAVLAHNPSKLMLFLAIDSVFIDCDAILFAAITVSD